MNKEYMLSECPLKALSEGNLPDMIQRAAPRAELAGEIGVLCSQCFKTATITVEGEKEKLVRTFTLEGCGRLTPKVTSTS